MPKINAVYVVGRYTNYGLKLYLSNVGYRSGDRIVTVWEPGFANARQFFTVKDAKDAADATGEGPYNIYKCSARKDNGFEMTTVK